jgi:hypothetical protein
MTASGSQGRAPTDRVPEGWYRWILTGREALPVVHFSIAADPDILVPLTYARTEFEAHTIAAALESAGIPSQVFAMTAGALQLGSGLTDPIRVMVRRRDLEEAGRTLRAVRQESIDIDWSEVDVGDESLPGELVVTCAQCGYNREGLHRSTPCPECGFLAHPIERTPGGARHANRRYHLRRAGFILMCAAAAAGAFAPRYALLILGMAMVLIFFPQRGPAANAR